MTAWRTIKDEESQGDRAQADHEAIMRAGSYALLYALHDALQIREWEHQKAERGS